MAHYSQQCFCKEVKEKFPEYFTNKRVLDVGSLNINGCNRDLFIDCDYTGLDIGEGDNVDVVCIAHEYVAEPFDVIISTQCFEHDMYLDLTLKNIVKLLKPAGLFFFVCATHGTGEHGTKNNGASDSPFTSKIPVWDEYYANVTEEMVRDSIDLDEIFSKYSITGYNCDLRFWGIKKN